MTLPFQLNQRTLLGVCASLAVIVCITFTYSITQWVSDWQLAHQTVAPAKHLGSNANARLIASIPDQHLFGQSIAATGDMPITNLQLRVTGIAREENDKNENISKAYISISGNPSKIYQVGDTLPDGVKVYEIKPDTIILENGGRLEKLPLPREHLEFKPRNTEGHLQ